MRVSSIQSSDDLVTDHALVDDWGNILTCSPYAPVLEFLKEPVPSYVSLALGNSESVNIARSSRCLKNYTTSFSSVATSSSCCTSGDMRRNHRHFIRTNGIAMFEAFSFDATWSYHDTCFPKLGPETRLDFT